MKFTVNRAVVQPVKPPVESITLVVTPQELAILRQSVGCTNISQRASLNPQVQTLLGQQTAEMSLFNALVSALQAVIE